MNIEDAKVVLLRPGTLLRHMQFFECVVCLDECGLTFRGRLLRFERQKASASFLKAHVRVRANRTARVADLGYKGFGAGAYADAKAGVFVSQKSE